MTGQADDPHPVDSSGRSSRRGRPPVLETDDQDQVLGLLIAVQDEHPWPGPVSEPQGMPPAAKFPAEPGKALQELKLAADTFPGVEGEAEHGDHVVQVLDRPSAQPYVSHGSELVERNGLAATRTSEVLHRPLPGAGNAVEQRDHIARLEVGVVNRL